MSTKRIAFTQDKDGKMIPEVESVIMISLAYCDNMNNPKEVARMICEDLNLFMDCHNLEIIRTESNYESLGIHPPIIFKQKQGGQ